MTARYTTLLAWVVTATLAFAGCTKAPDTTTASSADEAAQAQDETQDGAEGQAEDEGQTEEAAADLAAPLVSYLGPEGTYTQEACGVFFGGEGTYLPQDDVAASVQALVDGEADYAVIPQENAIGGPIAEYVDEVVGHEGVCVVGEVELPISQNLLAKPGASLDDIRTVYSHKQGIAQGSDWLAEHLPNAEVTEVSSTAEGARIAAEAEDGTCAAIGSAAAAEVYGLEVAADNIQMSDTNKTRFYVLSLGEPAREASDRMAFVASGEVGDLAELLASIETEGMEVVAVHDRPRKTTLGNYSYLVEVAGGSYDAFEVLVEANPVFDLRYLGSFPVR